MSPKIVLTRRVLSLEFSPDDLSPSIQSTSPPSSPEIPIRPSVSPSSPSGSCVETFGEPSEAVKEKTRQFFADAAVCGLSAVALGTNAPTVLREEAADLSPPGGRHRVRLLDPGRTREGHSRQLLRRSRVGLQRDQLRIQSQVRAHRGRIRTQRLLRRPRRRRPDGRTRWRPRPPRHDPARRDPGTPRRGLQPQELPHRPRGPRRHRLRGRLRRDDGRLRRADRIRDRHDRRPLHPVASHPRRQAALRFEGRVRRDLHRSRRRRHDAIDARLPRPP